MRARVVLALMTLLGVIAGSASAQWPSSPDSPRLLAATIAEEKHPLACPDGERGWVVAWEYFVGPFASRVQRLDRFGGTPWGAQGILLPGTVVGLAVREDGDAIIALRDKDSLFVQRVRLDGTPRWPGRGTYVGSGTWSPRFQRTSDGRHWLAWITLDDFRLRAILLDDVAPSATDAIVVFPIYRLWSSFDTALGTDDDLLVVRSFYPAGSANPALEAQKVRTDGSLAWTGDGVTHSVPGYDLVHPLIAADGTGGIYVGYGRESPSLSHAAVRRLHADGAPAWTPPERLLPGPYNSGGLSQMALDPLGRLTIFWRPSGPSGPSFIRLDPSGTWLHPSGGTTLTDPPRPGDAAFHVSGFADSGHVVVWGSADSLVAHVNLWAQAVDGDVRRWGAPGIRFLRYDLDDVYWADRPPVIAAGPRGDALLVWYAKLTSNRPNNEDVFLVHADENGRFGDTLPRITSMSDVPNDHGGVLHVAWDASPLDQPAGVVSGYEVAIEEADGSLTPCASLPAASQPSYECDCGNVATQGASPAKSRLRVVANLSEGVPLWSPPDSAWAIDDLGLAGTGDTRTPSLRLHHPAPSPAHGDFMARWDTPTRGRVKLTLHDTAGRCLATAHEGEVGQGKHEARVPLRASNGAVLPPGLYFLRLSWNGSVRTQRVVVAR